MSVVFLFMACYNCNELISSQASNEPDVYETSDLPEDDQAQFESVSICVWLRFELVILSLLSLWPTVTVWPAPDAGLCT